MKRSITDTKSGSIGLSFGNYPGLNYSIRLQDREDMIISFESSDSTIGLKEMSINIRLFTFF